MCVYYYVCIINYHILAYYLHRTFEKVLSKAHQQMPI